MFSLRLEDTLTVERYRQRKAGVQQHTFATLFIDHGQHPKFSAVLQLIMHEVHTPRLVRGRRRRCRSSMQTDPRLRRRTRIRTCRPCRQYSLYTRLRPAF
jgi:hypothetical protein